MAIERRSPGEGLHRPTIAMILLASVVQALAVGSIVGLTVTHAL